MKREKIADSILKRLNEERNNISHQFLTSQSSIGYFFVDDILPAEIAQKCFRVFPASEKMNLKKSIRENKYVSAQMDEHHPLLEEVIYAFQDERVVRFIGGIIGIRDIFPDRHLYAGGLSRMENEQFLNPHLDNSHDKERKRWRVLNLLYYVSPDWHLENGGNLEIWPKGLQNDQLTITSKFNRLIVMATHQESLHSVSPIAAKKARCCISNYYFSNQPLRESDRFHVTSFRARPEQKFKDKILQADTWLRMNVRKLFKKGIVKNPHIYKKEENKKTDD